MRSKKCFIVFIFVFAVFSVIGVSFSAYIIHGNNVDGIVKIKPNDISVINEKQNFLTYAGNKGIETYDNDIVTYYFSKRFFNLADLNDMNVKISDISDDIADKFL